MYFGKTNYLYKIIDTICFFILERTRKSFKIKLNGNYRYYIYRKDKLSKEVSKCAKDIRDNDTFSITSLKANIKLYELLNKQL